MLERNLQGAVQSKVQGNLNGRPEPDVASNCAGFERDSRLDFKEKEFSR